METRQKRTAFLPWIFQWLFLKNASRCFTVIPFLENIVMPLNSAAFPVFNVNIDAFLR